ncbi:MAG: hypothetical protein AAGA64_00255 [Bacteroidota bacterium]
MINISISSSWKIEELNLQLEILKENFKTPVQTHFFCNVMHGVFEDLMPHIEWKHIDHFYWHPDEGCGGPQEGSMDKINRRSRLIRLFASNIKAMGSLGQNFILIEGDTFPVDEEKFYNSFELLREYEIVANLIYFEKANPEQANTQEECDQLTAAKSQVFKMPEGFLLPAPVFMRHDTGVKLGNWMLENRDSCVKDGMNLEGAIAAGIKALNLRQINYSKVFTYAHPRFRQMDPATSVIHQHNMMNMAEVFVRQNITKGVWVNKVIRGKKIKRLHNGEIIKPNEDKPMICSLDLTKLGGIDPDGVADLPILTKI